MHNAGKEGMGKKVLPTLLVCLALLAAVILLIAVNREEPEDEAPVTLQELQTPREYYQQLRGRGISLNVYNWGEYLSDGSDGTLNVNREFEDLTGIKVYYSTYATNEELYSKLRSGSANYDVIIPSDYMIGRMISEGMLEELDRNNLPNVQNVGEGFRDPIFDPESRYSIPFTWGVVGIIYNTSMICEGDDVESWDILWDEKYRGEILMFANSRDAFGIAQKRRGYSMNTTEESQLRDCLEDLKVQKPLVQAYVMDEIFDKMLGGEAALAPYYAGDAVTMIDENENLDFAVPREGTNIFIDAACIPKGARQKAAAELYINFLLEPEVAAANADYIGYATPNIPAMELLDEDVVENPIAYPGEEVLQNAEFYNELPRETSLLVDRMWTELLSDDEQYNRLVVPIFVLLAVLVSVGLNVYRIWKKRSRSYLQT